MSMSINAKSKAEAWETANAIIREPLVVTTNGSREQTLIVYKTESDDFSVYEYDDELEIIFSNGDSMEIFFPEEKKEIDVDELNRQIAELANANQILYKDNSELKARIQKLERMEEQNKTLKRMIATYSEVAEDVEEFLDSVTEFREFLGKVRDLKRSIKAEGDAK